MIRGSNLINYLNKIASSEYSVTNFYTYKKNLSRKIYSTVSEASLNKKVLFELIDKSKKLKNIIDKYHFFQANFSINLIEISDPSKLEATLKDNAANNEVYYIKINKVASSQEVKSIDLRPDDDIVLDDGIYKFAINIDNTDIQVDFHVSHLDIPKNRDLLNTLAYVINRLNIGLNAEVYTTKKRSLNSADPNSLIKHVYLKITNLETGKNHYFEFYDLDKDLINKLKLNEIQRPSQNTEFSVNKIEESTPFDEVVEDDGRLLLKFLEPSDEEIVLKSKKINNLKNYLSNIIDEFNQYIDWIYKNQDFFSNRLIFDLKDIFSNHFKNLKEMDLTLDQNDKILIGTYFQEVINTNPIKYINYLFGKSGFFTDIKKFLNKIINSPGDYQLTEDKLSLYSRYGNIHEYKDATTTNTIQFRI